MARQHARANEPTLTAAPAPSVVTVFSTPIICLIDTLEFKLIRKFLAEIEFRSTLITPLQAIPRSILTIHNVNFTQEKGHPHASMS